MPAQSWTPSRQRYCMTHDMRLRSIIVDTARGVLGRCVWPAALWAMVASAELSAAPILTATSNGAGALSVTPGQTVDLHIDLSGLAAELTVSAGYEVRFSVAGLGYQSYVWTLPFASGAGDDLSDPVLASLPAVIADDLFGSAGSLIDVHFDNFASSGGVGNGTLTTLTLEVPIGFPTPSAVVVDVVPGEFVFDDSPFAETPATGPSFVLNVDSAGAVVAATLRAVQTPTSPERGMLPDGITTACFGGRVYVEAWVSQIDGGAAGIAAGSLDLLFENAVTTADAIDHGGIFQGAATGTIDNAAGLIDDLGGATTTPGVGVTPEWALLGRVVMSATAVGTATFTLAHGGVGFSLADGQGPLNGDSLVSLGQGQSVTVTQVQQIGDTDCDQDVDLDDFARFHACADASDPLGDPPLPTECTLVDLDSDGDVDRHDFAILQVRFGIASD